MLQRSFQTRFESASAADHQIGDTPTKLAGPAIDQQTDTQSVAFYCQSSLSFQRV